MCSRGRGVHQGCRVGGWVAREGACRAGAQLPSTAGKNPTEPNSGSSLYYPSCLGPTLIWGRRSALRSITVLRSWPSEPLLLPILRPAQDWGCPERIKQTNASQPVSTLFLHTHSHKHRPHPSPAPGLTRVQSLWPGLVKGPPLCHCGKRGTLALLVTTQDSRQCPVQPPHLHEGLHAAVNVLLAVHR